jgi:hypothetical protein
MFSLFGAARFEGKGAAARHHSGGGVAFHQ